MYINLLLRAQSRDMKTCSSLLGCSFGSFKFWLFACPERFRIEEDKRLNICLQFKFQKPCIPTSKYPKELSLLDMILGCLKCLQKAGSALQIAKVEPPFTQSHSCENSSPQKGLELTTSLLWELKLRLPTAMKMLRLVSEDCCLEGTFEN